MLEATFRITGGGRYGGGRVLHAPTRWVGEHVQRRVPRAHFPPNLWPGSRGPVGVKSAGSCPQGITDPKHTGLVRSRLESKFRVKLLTGSIWFPPINHFNSGEIWRPSAELPGAPGAAPRGRRLGGSDPRGLWHHRSRGAGRLDGRPWPYSGGGANQEGRAKYRKGGVLGGCLGAGSWELGVGGLFSIARWSLEDSDTLRAFDF